MKIISICKAYPITDNMPVEDVQINITGNGQLPGNPFNSLHSAKLYYESEAKKLYDALSNSLPQGMIEPLVIEFMKQRISMYRGTMERIKE